MKLYKKYDGTIEDGEGNIIFFSLDRFIREICKGSHCFLCGASSDSKRFNNEHIIPKWLLRKYSLYTQSITLSNNGQIRYDKYTVPCCSDCNSLLGTTLEDEIRNVIEGGLESVNRYIQEVGPLKIFLWLSLIFFKTHLKDSYLKINLDQRMSNETIAYDYDWALMHHIHCIIRTILTGVSIDSVCLGSIFVLPAKVSKNYADFDYRDIYGANTMLLRLGDIAFVSVLDDSCAATHFFSSHLEKISGPLSPIQLREVLSHLTLINLKLKYRPVYSTNVDAYTGQTTISAKLPESMELEEHNKEEFGEILYANVSEFVEKMQSPDANFNEECIKSGGYRFLFDETGKFDVNSMEMIEESC